MVRDRVAVVTGASSGIGRAIAIQFARLGYSVAAHGFRNREGLKETREEIESYWLGSRQNASAGDVVIRLQACEFLADISDAKECQRLVDEAFAWKGAIDVWVNAAGADVLTGDHRALSFEEKLDLLWTTDVAGTIRISRLVADKMRRQKKDATSLNGGTNQDREIPIPSIVNISWDQAEQGMEGDSGQFFSTTKAAISAFSKSLAKTVGPEVRVNCVAPGWIQTEWGKSAPPEWDSRARGESMLNRWGTPEDIANVVAMISQPGCEFVNGQNISVNGGWKPGFPKF